MDKGIKALTKAGAKKDVIAKISDKKKEAADNEEIADIAQKRGAEGSEDRRRVEKDLNDRGIKTPNRNKDTFIKRFAKNTTQLSKSNKAKIEKQEQKKSPEKAQAARRQFSIDRNRGPQKWATKGKFLDPSKRNNLSGREAVLSPDKKPTGKIGFDRKVQDYKDKKDAIKNKYYKKKPEVKKAQDSIKQQENMSKLAAAADRAKQESRNAEAEKRQEKMKNAEYANKKKKLSGDGLKKYLTADKNKTK